MTDVALIHAGIADSRMWAPQLQSVARDHRVVAPDLPGFGKSPFTSNVVDYRAAVRDALDAAGMDRAALVATSAAGMISLGFTLESPERVGALVLVGAGLDGHDWSDEMIELDTAEESALDRGDLDAAVDSQLRWVTGPRDDIQQIADKLAAGIPGAERATIPDAAHLPNLERPEAFDRIVLGFLAQQGA